MLEPGPLAARGQFQGLEACQQVWAQTGIDRSEIAGVSLTTQRGTVINVDAQGKPLRPAILWLDQRQSEVEGGIKGPWGWLFKLVGAQATVDSAGRRSGPAAHSASALHRQRDHSSASFR